MTDLMPISYPVQPRPVARDREGTAMLIHEELARSRQHEAEQAARDYAVVRSFTAGRRWARIARFATRRAERARAGTDAAARSSAGGLRSAV